MAGSKSNDQESAKVPDANRKIFLSASWLNLVLFNYAVDPQVLMPHLPQGCELDLLNDEAFLSLVAFQFRHTKVFGFRWPGWTNFPEINLRFYIRYRGERGVCFVREYVPSQLIAGFARLIYNEPYKAARMTEHVTVSEDRIVASYGIQDGLARFECRVQGRNQPFMPAADSAEHFFKEHELGVGRNREGRTMTYRVHHPHWRIYPVETYELSIDAAGLYGADFAFLQNTRPNSVVFAEGSPIEVYKKSDS